jgi:hypothetical protein
MPKSLSRFLENFQRDDEEEGKPRYLMNVATFAPLGTPDWNGTAAEDPLGNLWYVYYWTDRPARGWNTALPSSTLSLLVSEFDSGTLSHVAYGAIRQTLNVSS